MRECVQCSNLAIALVKLMLCKIFLSKNKRQQRTQETLLSIEEINLHSFLYIHIYIHIHVSKPDVMFQILQLSKENDTDLLVSKINCTLKIKHNL